MCGGGCGGTNVTQRNPTQIELDAIKNESEAAVRLSDYAIESDKANRERLAALDVQQQAVVDDYLRTSQTSKDRSNQMWGYYLSEGRPAVSQALNDARNWDSAGALDLARSQAYADTEQAFGQQRDSAMRNLSRMGVNPASGRYMESLSGAGANAALAKVQAANSMVEGRKATAAQLRQQAANIANGFQASSLNLSNLGNASNQGATATGQNGMANALGIQSAYTNTMGAAGNMFGNAASNYTNSYQTYVTPNNSASGLGSMVGMLGGSAISTWGKSDRRLKENIVRIGTTSIGLPVYRFDFIDGEKNQIGCMADEVELLVPEAVAVGSDGYKMVNYALVG